ncbi:MAG TPA: hypothetical protein PK669_12840 [Methanosarcina thermophila]|nr:hypothetical protein [Methanosarcina thermophila]HOA70040.1 hypothetical protein [Methanosarcina thermophila]HOQ66811.1 hypothetical protein [Methanosarcina thermophila]HPT81952.1 hypothetical protein [Methanosarcina thermophila]HPZ21196.1 hypothetical protein [Methanosarcina thermophila]HQD95557.1 hypothetical protein [Methanosarcina thermophila]
MLNLTGFFIVSDPVAMIQMIRTMNPAIVQSLLPGGKKVKGVM